MLSLTDFLFYWLCEDTDTLRIQDGHSYYVSLLTSVMVISTGICMLCIGMVLQWLQLKLIRRAELCMVNPCVVLLLLSFEAGRVVVYLMVFDTMN
jgi:hypothetical protein